MIRKEDIIAQLYSDVVTIHIDGDSYTCLDKDSKAVTIDLDAVNTEFTKQDYKNKRVSGVGTTSGYDKISNQLDQLYHDMQDGKLGVAATTGQWYVGITSVKTRFPKSS